MSIRTLVLKTRVQIDCKVIDIVEKIIKVDFGEFGHEPRGLSNGHPKKYTIKAMKGQDKSLEGWKK